MGTRPTLGSLSNDLNIKAIRIYSKAVPDATFVDIEKRMREENCGLYLIAEVRLRIHCLVGADRLTVVIKPLGIHFAVRADLD